MKKPAQNLVEFVFIFPLLLGILFGILEFAMFYRNVSVVQDIATEASVVASRRLVLDTMTNTTLGNANFNIAVNDAVNVVISRKGNLALNALAFTCPATPTAFGIPPNALYTCNSTQTRVIEGVATPVVTIFIDYRNAAEDGIAVQLLYQYKTLLVGMSMPSFGAAPLVIIPRDIPISSTKVRQYLSY